MLLFLRLALIFNPTRRSWLNATKRRNLLRLSTKRLLRILVVEPVLLAVDGLEASDLDWEACRSHGRFVHLKKLLANHGYFLKIVLSLIAVGLIFLLLGLGRQETIL